MGFPLAGHYSSERNFAKDSFFLPYFSFLFRGTWHRTMRMKRTTYWERCPALGRCGFCKSTSTCPSSKLQQTKRESAVVHIFSETSGVRKQDGYRVIVGVSKNIVGRFDDHHHPRDAEVDAVDVGCSHDDRDVDVEAGDIDANDVTACFRYIAWDWIRANWAELSAYYDTAISSR